MTDLYIAFDICNYTVLNNGCVQISQAREIVTILKNFIGTYLGRRACYTAVCSCFEDDLIGILIPCATRNRADFRKEIWRCVTFST